MRRRATLLATCVVAFLAWGVVACAGEGNVPSLLLAQVYDWNEELDLSQYWASEKYDGVRACWDGERLRFRSGRLVAAPAWFVAGLPKVALDGELWLGRNTFQRLEGIVRKKVADDREWRDVRFMVFELPGAGGSFTERIAQIERVVADAHKPWLQATPQFRIPDRQTLKKRLAEVVQSGGEGLMLHRADSQYHAGRSRDLLKVKRWLDSEAEVIAYRPGAGKYQGLTGALEVKAPDGTRFSIGSGLTDADRRQPPPLGSTITYRYTGLTAGGMPRFPIFLRLKQNL